MSYAPDASKEYLKNTVMTASSEQLQLMLLDGAIRFATRGLEAIRDNNIEDTFNALERAQRIVIELSNGLRRENNPQLVDQMSALFGFVFRRLVEGNMQRDAQAVEDALKILRDQRETWAIIVDKLSKDTSLSSQPGFSSMQEGVQSAENDENSRFVAEG